MTKVKKPITPHSHLNLWLL